MDQALLPYVAAAGLAGIVLVAFMMRTPNDAGRGGQMGGLATIAWAVVIAGAVGGALWAMGIVDVPFLRY